MRDRRRVWTWVLLALVVCTLAGLVWAQSPKKEKPAQEEAKPAQGEVKPAAPTASSAAEDPLVRAVLETRPTTPQELVRAGKLLAELNRPELAKRYFQQVLDAKLDAAQLEKLSEELGPEVFVEIGSRKDVAPEGRQLAAAVQAAVAQQAQDPQRIAAVIARLRDPSPDVRRAAAAGLQKSGGVAVGALVAVLADPKRDREHAHVQAALVQMGEGVLEPLLGVLDARDAKIAAQAARVIGEMKGQQTFIHLLAPALRSDKPELSKAAQAALVKRIGSVPSRAEAARFLADQARRYFDQKQPLRADSTDQVTFWSWDDTQGGLIAQEVPRDDASRRNAVRFARDAHMVLPEDKDLLALFLATMLEQASYAQGLDKPLSTAKDTLAGEIDKYDAEVLERVVGLCLNGDHAPAATAAVRLLGRKEQAERLLSRSRQSSPLVLATRHADRRLRLAAAEAIVEMRPVLPFPGASWVLEDLSHLAASNGSRRAILAGTRVADLQRAAGYLAKLGYQTDVVASGADLFHRLFASPDYELVLVDAGVNRPTLEFLLQQMRHDGRTAALAVGIYARPEQIEQARHIARDDPRAEVFAYPFEESDADWQVKRLVALGGRDVLPVAQRQQQAVRALELLGAIATTRRPDLYDMRRAESTVLDALNVSPLAARAAAVSGRLGTPQSQTALVEVASRRTAPLAIRRAALDAFRDSVEQYGLLLTTTQIQLQYDRYNQSATQDSTTQKVLGMILDCIEAPTQAGKRQARAAAPEEPRMAGLKR